MQHGHLHLRAPQQAQLSGAAAARGPTNCGALTASCPVCVALRMQGHRRPNASKAVFSFADAFCPSSDIDVLNILVGTCLMAALGGSCAAVHLKATSMGSSRPLLSASTLLNARFATHAKNLDASGEASGAGSAQVPAQSPDCRRRISAFEPVCTAAALCSLSRSQRYRLRMQGRYSANKGAGKRFSPMEQPHCCRPTHTQATTLGPAQAYAPVAAAKA